MCLPLTEKGNLVFITETWMMALDCVWSPRTFTSSSSNLCAPTSLKILASIPANLFFSWIFKIQNPCNGGGGDINLYWLQSWDESSVVQVLHKIRCNIFSLKTFRMKYAETTKGHESQIMLDGIQIITTIKSCQKESSTKLKCRRQNVTIIYCLSLATTYPLFHVWNTCKICLPFPLMIYL